MRKTIFTPHECRFLAVTAVVLVCIAGLAFWYAVPFRAEEAAPASVLEPLRDSFRVDLNTAGPEALSTLPGIGEQKAKAIVEYRSTHGRFRSLADAARVPGITQDMIDEWQGLAYVS